MKLLEKYNFPSQTIYDGIYDSEQIFKEYNIQITDLLKTAFCLNDATTYDIDVLLESLSEKDKEWFFNEEKLKNTPPSCWKSRMSESDFNTMKFDYYKRDYHLPIKYLQKDDLIFIYTYGEKQPSRWILIIESIWKIPPASASL
ncbi:MAG: hypothetical protein JKX79_04980 [Labilibaculum sp.]|nr:hypothetical protein [Labilibaculum sp.]